MTTLMNGDALAAMEQLDGAGGGSNVDLLADQAMRNGVEEAIDFDMIIEGDAGQAPFRKLVVGVGKRRQERPLDRLEQMPSADAEPAHAMRAVGASGASYATLGLSPLSQRAGVSLPPQPLWLRFVLEWIKLHGARFYNFVGLDSFKAKFNPDQWEPIYAIAEGARFSAAALYGIAGAFSGGGPIRLVVVALVRAAVREMRTLLNRVRSKGRRQL